MQIYTGQKRPVPFLMLLRYIIGQKEYAKRRFFLERLMQKWLVPQTWVQILIFAVCLFLWLPSPGIAQDNSQLAAESQDGSAAVRAAEGKSENAESGIENGTGTEAVNKDMVWAASDGLSSEIYISSEQDGTWSEPLQVTNNNAENLVPCIDSTQDGTKYLTWASLEEGNLNVRYMTGKNAVWSEPQSIPDLPVTSTTPFVAVDKNDVVWLVFAGNSGGNDDVYCTRLVKGKWTAAARINAENNVPDINPFIEIGEDGTVQVFWQGFRDGAYVILSSVWQQDAWSEEKRVDDEALAAIELKNDEVQASLPDFVANNKTVFIRTAKKEK